MLFYYVCNIIILWSNLETLKEIFHTLSQGNIEKALLQHSFSEAVDHLLACQEQMNSSSTCEQDHLDTQLQQNETENSNLDLIRIEVISHDQYAR